MPLCAQRTRRQRGFTLIELMIVVVIVGILAMLSIYGVRNYVTNSKSAEAVNSIGQISKDAQTAFERESMKPAVLGVGVTSGVTRALCGSASASVPTAITSVQARKYQSNQAAGQDWTKDESTNLGFACLKFLMTSPQYYMYDYSSDGNQNTPTMGTQFTAVANGDLNGNGTMSTFQLVGAVSNNMLYVAPNILTVLPNE
jgi:type IV pilus assembly protein PilA